MEHTQRNSLSPPKLTIIAALSIVIIGLVVYHRVPFQEIANYDEMIWVGAVQQPSSATLKRIVAWDLTWGEAGSKKIGYYAPLTAASIMLDLRLGEALGKTDAVLKTSNLVLHLLNSLVVLWLIRCLGFSLWISFTVASIFAIHPLQVSTVAWIAERKNLLAGFSFLVGLLCYCRYRQTEKRGFYWVALAAYCPKPPFQTIGSCFRPMHGHNRLVLSGQEADDWVTVEGNTCTGTRHSVDSSGERHRRRRSRMRHRYGTGFCFSRSRHAFSWGSSFFRLA